MILSRGGGGGGGAIITSSAAGPTTTKALLVCVTLLLCVTVTSSQQQGEGDEKTLRWADAVENARGTAVATDLAGDIYVGGTVDGVRGRSEREIPTPHVACPTATHTSVDFFLLEHPAGHHPIINGWKGKKIGIKK